MDEPRHESEPHDTDGALMGLIANGQGEYVRVLIERYQRALLTFLRRATSEPVDADDLFQETWMRVVRSAHRYDPSYRFSSWLFTIASNLVRDRWNRRKATEAVATEQQIESFQREATTPAAAEESLMACERAAAVTSRLDELPPLLAQAIRLRYFDELSERDMASALNVPAGTVKSRLHHGLRKLGQLLEGSLP